MISVGFDDQPPGSLSSFTSARIFIKSQSIGAFSLTLTLTALFIDLEVLCRAVFDSQSA